jgi:hypothetical protein
MNDLTAKGTITPGTTIMFTDKAVDPITQSHTDFQILVAQKGQALQNDRINLKLR